ncbi:hypothetical protein [Campylobacter concisus]|uniref:hypothetical protein n=2 Tax=Campylobacter concisus TaxID=199 RepID=UPI003D1C8F0F
MKRLAKKIMPPILLNGLRYARSYIHFLKYKEVILKNINLKDKHKGKRCFILGSGPSIKSEDLKPLKNEIVFALNNFYVHNDFDEIVSGDIQKYYLVAPIHPPQTEDEWKRWFKDMEKHVPVNVNMIFGLDMYDYNIRYILEKYVIFKKHNINWYFAGINVDKEYKFKEKDISIENQIWAANTASTYALIVAIYMGFKEIYLLGVDHNYICLKNEESFRFYKTSIHQHNEQRRMCIKKSDEFFSTGKVFLEKELIAENFKNGKIFNCSVDSLLNMFEYKRLNSLMINKI